MNFSKTKSLAWLLLLTPLLAGAGGEEVVVVYNSRLPESQMVAEHYAAARAVPKNQVFGLPLNTNEVMTRVEFTDSLQLPLAEKLEAAGLWKFGKIRIPATNEQSARTEIRVVKSKIRYAVLCYGVPLKIAPDALMEAVAAKNIREEFRRNEAAVDSELAWLPVSRQDLPLTGPLPNPFYTITNHAMLNATNGILLVTRLDGPTAQIANGLVDKALEAENNGFWGRAYFDTRGLSRSDTNYYLGDQWLLAGAEICRQLGFEVETDTNAATLPASYPMSQIAIYAGWYAGDANGPFTLPKVEFMPGAFAYHLYSFSADSLRTPTGHWCGPLLAKGATCTMGCVYEPFLQFTPNIAFFLQAFGNGYTFGEAAWASQMALSWQTTVIGDPLYQPFKKNPALLHAELTRSHNPLLEWSFLRLVNLDLAHGVRGPVLTRFLENIPTTATSAVLTEKLAELYDQLGKPESAINAWQHALTLNPSPQQRIRIRRVLEEKLLAQNRITDALENDRQFIAEAPDYPGRPAIEEKLKSLQSAAENKKP
jgi:uncharacterized protein (TIGR03790 family)